MGSRPHSTNLIDIVKASKVTISSTLKKRTIDLHIESEILRILRLRILDAKLRGVQPGPEASVTKAIGDDHGQRVMNLAKDLSGANGMLTDVGPLETNVKLWHHGFLYSRALTIGGGTSQIQRTIIAERALGLPAEPRLL
jgi:alkylation response protein AidB-like acyl-CoA dehydrogenase